MLDDPAGLRRRRRTAAAGGAAIVVVVLVVAAFLLGGRNQERPAAAGSSGPTASAIPSTPAGTDAALTRMRQVLDQGAAEGDVRSDVALDFTNLIGDLQARLTAGETVDLGAQVRQLRIKINQRLREGGLSERRAQELTSALSGIPAQ
jgi:serine/threonine-protein kinase